MEICNIKELKKQKDNATILKIVKCFLNSYYTENAFVDISYFNKVHYNSENYNILIDDDELDNFINLHNATQINNTTKKKVYKI